MTRNAWKMGWLAAVSIAFLAPGATPGHPGAPGGGSTDGWVDVHGDTLHGGLIVFQPGYVRMMSGTGIWFPAGQLTSTATELEFEGKPVGDITQVNAGNGLDGGGSQGEVTLSASTRHDQEIGFAKAGFTFMDGDDGWVTAGQVTVTAPSTGLLVPCGFFNQPRHRWFVQASGMGWEDHITTDIVSVKVHLSEDPSSTTGEGRRWFVAKDSAFDEPVNFHTQNLFEGPGGTKTFFLRADAEGGMNSKVRFTDVSLSAQYYGWHCP